MGALVTFLAAPSAAASAAAAPPRPDDPIPEDVGSGLEDAKFLDVDEKYLVGARFDPELGGLSSNVRPPEPLFGGNDVIGLNDTDVKCPVIDDPVRTLQPNGESVDSGVVTPLFRDKRLLLATLGVPVAIAFAVVIGLVLLRNVWGLFIKSIFELGRADVT